MLFTDECVLEQVAQSVFSTMLNIDLTRVEQPVPPHAELLLATVQIAGKWTGSVVLALSSDIARASAANMLQLAVDDVTPGDQQDAAAELVNMIGGNVKGLLPGPSFLSLPTIVTGREFGQQIHDAEIIENVTLTSESGTLQVTLYMQIPVSVRCNETRGTTNVSLADSR
jgi:chemotaxis protein CheX